MLVMPPALFLSALTNGTEHTLAVSTQCGPLLALALAEEDGITQGNNQHRLPWNGRLASGSRAGGATWGWRSGGCGSRKGVSPHCWRILCDTARQITQRSKAHSHMETHTPAVRIFFVCSGDRSSFLLDTHTLGQYQHAQVVFNLRRVQEKLTMLCLWGWRTTTSIAWTLANSNYIHASKLHYVSRLQ